MTITFEEYIKKIEADYRRGNATEYTYRGSLELLVESYGKGVDASNDPKHIECGAPDFIVEKGKVPLGYIETKDVGADLDKIEKSDQMKRYLPALHNLILTDYVEFRWYVNGERKLKFKAAEFGKNNKLTAVPQAAETIEKLIKDFLDTETPTVGTPKELAQRLAGVTHFIRDQIANALESGDPDLQKALSQQYKTFVDLLLPALKPREFADLYAQAITYGLFAAKLSAPEGAPFAFEDAYKYLRANPFLRRLFMDVNDQLDELDIIQPYLKDLVSLLNRADFPSILADFGRRTRTEDPVVHFYETFLATYDPKMRESRGVYYTPEPVVRFIVRSVDEILKTRFNKPWGLADESVKALDPATGTGTFLYYVIQQIHNEIVNERGQGGQWAQKSKSMLKRLFGFELLIAPYVVSHLKLGLLMQSLGVPLEGKDERLQVYLTNTLEEGVERADTLAGLGLNIAEESSEAAKVKKADDIMVVLGNPPYSYESTNNGKWISDLVRDYYQVDGVSLGEANPKGLQDDYVKFIRYGEYRINKTGHGVLAFITNHGYLDNPTFRGMRQHLLNTFDEIYVLDLHGNSKKKEKAPDGSKDENVFDIQQGVAILLAIKNGVNPNKGGQSLSQKTFGDAKTAPSAPTINHIGFWGLREEKYSLLHKVLLPNIKWKQILPKKPHYLFVPQNTKLLPEYEKNWQITDIMQKNSVGLYTARDDFAIQQTADEVNKNIRDFVNLPFETARTKFNLGEDSRDWQVKFAQNDIKSSGSKENNIVPIDYRPFDIRFTYYTGKSKGFHCMPRGEIMRNLVRQDNIALVSLRRTRGQEDWNYAFIGSHIIDKSCITSLDNASVFPLYLYSENNGSTGTLFAQTEPTRQSNLAPAFLKELSGKLGLQFVPDGQGDLKTTFGPEDVFYYAYAVFHSPTYRSRYAEFLKIDFPRLPLTSNRKLFAALAAKGKELVELHLLKNPKVENFITTYPVVGDNVVVKVGFVASPPQTPSPPYLSLRSGMQKPRPSPASRRGSSGSNGRVWINPRQYFGGVPEEVWNFKIGGYQVCDKWLKDRKGRVLSGEDISHYQRVVVSLKETIRLMAEIDMVIPKWPIEQEGRDVEII
ncbi:MAG: N-6 DNA methylase [Chloroflexi bacterium]|nr:MAG: N-6 DNA methylase [Chloroflexota bacterium]